MRMVARTNRLWTRRRRRTASAGAPYDIGRLFSRRIGVGVRTVLLLFLLRARARRRPPPEVRRPLRSHIRDRASFAFDVAASRRSAPQGATPKFRYDCAR